MSGQSGLTGQGMGWGNVRCAPDGPVAGSVSQNCVCRSWPAGTKQHVSSMTVVLWQDRGRSVGQVCGFPTWTDRIRVAAEAIARYATIVRAKVLYIQQQCRSWEGRNQEIGARFLLLKSSKWIDAEEC